MWKYFCVIFILLTASNVFSQCTLSIRQVGLKTDSIPEIVIVDDQNQIPVRLNDSTILFNVPVTKSECLFIFLDVESRWWTRVWIDSTISHKELIVDYSKKMTSIKSGNEIDIVLEKVIEFDLSGKSIESDSISFEYLNKNPNSFFSLWLLSHGLYNDNPKKQLIAFNSLGASLMKYPEYKQVRANLLERKYPNIGDTLKEFTLTDKNNMLFNSNSIKNKWIILHFWSNSCGPCVREMDDWIKLYSTIDSSQVVFIFIGLDDEMLKWKFGNATNKITWISLWTEGNAFCKLCLNYNVDQMPFSVLFNKEKKIEMINFDLESLKMSSKLPKIKL